MKTTHESPEVLTAWVADLRANIINNPLTTAYSAIDQMSWASDQPSSYKLRGDWIEAGGRLILEAVRHPKMPADQAPGILAMGKYLSTAGNNFELLQDMSTAYEVSVAPLTRPVIVVSPESKATHRIVAENQRATPLIADFPMKDASSYL